MSDNLEKLRKLVEVANEDRPSTKEVVAMFQALIKVIKDTKAQLTQELADSKGEMSDSVLDALKDIKGAEKRILDASERASELIKKAEIGLTQADAKLEQSKEKFSIDTTAIAKQLQEEVKRVKKIISDIPEADFSGVLAEIERVQNMVLLIPEHPSPEEHRDALEGLLDMDDINGLIDEFKKVREEIVRSTRRGGGHTDVGIKYTIGRIIKTETPTGLLNGSNKEYTVTQPIHAVLGFMLNGEAIALSNYTITNNKLTFSATLPAAYSGRDFEIIYI